MAPPESFAVQVVRHADSVELVLAGEIDMAVEHTFATAIEAAMSASPHLVLNVALVSFMDSSGLRPILRAIANRDPDGSITIRNPQREVRRLMTLSGIDDLVTIELAT